MKIRFSLLAGLAALGPLLLLTSCASDSTAATTKAPDAATSATPSPSAYSTPTYTPPASGAGRRY